MRKLVVATLLLTFGICFQAGAQVIAVVAPASGPHALLGNQIRNGARSAAGVLGLTLHEIDEPCSPETGGAVAAQLVAAGAELAVGFLCVETLAEGLPALAENDIGALTVSVRSGILMEDALRRGWPFFRLAPAEADEPEKLAQFIVERWKAEPVALVDDGTIYGRELVADIHERITPLGITPVFTDTFRPGQEQQLALVRRLAKAGATHVLVGGDRQDTAIIARDALSEKLALTILGGDALRAADRPVPLADGVLAATVPDHVADAETAAAKALAAAGIRAEGYVLPAYAAVEIAARAIREKADGPAWKALAATGFDTVIGPVAFGTDHELRHDPLQVLQWRDGAFRPLQPGG